MQLAPGHVILQEHSATHWPKDDQKCLGGISAITLNKQDILTKFCMQAIHLKIITNVQIWLICKSVTMATIVFL